MKWKFKHFCNYVQLAKCFGHFGNIRIIEIELQTKVFFAALRCASRPLCDHLQLAQILRAQDFLPLRVKFKQVRMKRPIPVTFVTSIRTRNLLFIDINSNNSSEPGWGSCPNEGETIKLEAREIRLNSWWVAPWWWWWLPEQWFRWWWWWWLWVLDSMKVILMMTMIINIIMRPWQWSW